MLEVKSGGIETTVQDYPGRVGLLDQGIFPAGPMDDLAFRMANLLVGNDPGAAGLEVTAGGAEFAFTDNRVVAVCGADMQPRINGEPIELWRSYEVKAGDTLTLGWLNGPGFRSYVAVSGGIDVPVVLGSRATYAPGEIGGYEGRALKEGDQLPLGNTGNATPGRRVKPSLVPAYTSEWVVEAVRGPQADPDYFTTEDMEFFFSHAWTLDRNSNRTGYRLDIHQWQWARKTGGVAGGHPSNILDNGYPVGAVNVAGDQPIILTVDGPTLGGFVCCAVVAMGAMWKLGQMVPGWDKIRFKEVDIAQAAELVQQMNQLISEESLEGV